MKRTILISAAFVALIPTLLFAGSMSERSKYPLIVAHYMAWYQTPEVSGSWGFWQTNRDNIDKRYWKFPEFRNFQGQRQVSSVFYPIIGPYDSADPDLCEYHILQAWLAGIDAFVCDWYGPGHYYDDIAFKAMKRKAEELGFFKVAICWEDQSLFPGYAPSVKSRGQAVELAKTTLHYLEKEWFSSPAYLTIDDRPVLTDYAWGSPGPKVTDIWLSGDEWDTVLATAAVRPVLIHDWHSHYWNKDAFEKYDSILPWGDCYHGNSIAIPRFWKLSEQLLDTGNFSFLSGTVLPGFDNRGCGGWGTGSAIGMTSRENGAKFRATWEDVVKQPVEFIQIATWNDLNEGGTIEPVRLGITDRDNPASGYGYRELETVQEYASRLKHIPVDTAALRIPASIYLCRKIIAALYPDTASAEYVNLKQQVDAARTALLAGQTATAEQMLNLTFSYFSSGGLINPDFIKYDEKQVLPEPVPYDGLFDKWGIQACDPSLGPTFQTNFIGADILPHPGKENILLVRPMSKDVPVTLTRTVIIADTGPRLRFSLSPNTGQLAKSGFLLTVRINGKEMKRELVAGRNKPFNAGWKDYSFDLPAGEDGARPCRAAIDIEIRADKSIPWEYSHCFIAGLMIDGVDQASSTQVVTLGGWANDWEIIGSSRTILPQIRKNYNGIKYQPFSGKQDMVMVHPASDTTPVIMTRKTWLPANNPVLHLSASPSIVPKLRSDFFLQVMINGAVETSVYIHPSSTRSWRDITVPLFAYADKPADMKIIVSRDKSDTLAFDHCFLADVSISGIDPVYENVTDLRDFAKDWQVSGCDLGKGPFYITDYRFSAEYPHPGKNASLQVHPLGQDRSVFLSRQVRVADTGGLLTFAVSADAARLNISDFISRVYIDDTVVFADTIYAGARLSNNAWKFISIDLAPYSGKEILIKIEAAAGGLNPWAWEFAYFSEIRLAGCHDLVLQSKPNWNSTWQVLNSGKEVAFKKSYTGDPDYPHPGKTGILVTHPKNEKEPCVLTRTVKLPADKACNLQFAVSADAAQLNVADVTVTVKINKQSVYRGVIEAGSIRSKNGWRIFKFNLDQYRGKTVTVDIIVSGGGYTAWGWEYAFFSDLMINGID